MTRKATTPKEVTEILALREVGYTVLAISQKLNISVRTIGRHLAIHGSKKGSLKQEAIESARTELFKLINSNTAIREEAAKLLADDIAHSNHLRAILIEASELLKATTLTEAVLVMRGAVAYSTAFKNTSDTIRHALGVDKLIDDTDDLPELTVRELTTIEIAHMIKRQEKDYGVQVLEVVEESEDEIIEEG